MPHTNSKNTKQLILNAGKAAINSKSYHACGLQEILKAAGVAKGSFYHHFKSKEDFGFQLIQESADEYAQFMRDILIDSQYLPLQRLRNLFEKQKEYFILHHFNYNCTLPKMALETSQLSETLRAAIRYSFDTNTTILAQTIREAQAAQMITTTMDAQVIADMINCSFQGIMIRAQINQSIEPLEHYIEFIFQHVFTTNI